MSLIKVRRIATLDGEDKHNGKDSIAMDAKFKIGDKVKLSGSHPRFPNKVGVVTHVFPTGFIKVKVDGVEDIEIAENLVAADSRATDACGTDAKLQKGDKVRVWQYPVYGKLGEVVEATYGGMEYTVNVEGKDYPRIDYRRIVKVSDAAGDAAEFHVGQKVRHTRFGTIGKVFEIAPDGAIGVQWSNGQAYYGEFHRPLSEIVAVDACEDSSELNNDAGDADEDNYYLTAKKSIEDAGRLLASAVISLSRSKAPNAKEVHAELTRMSDMFERIRKRI